MVSLPNQRPVVALLGFAFTDPVTLEKVTEGLVVTARALGSGCGIRKAFTTPSGNYAFCGLPGLHDLEYPETARRAASAGVTFIIEVADALRRFLPIAFLFEGAVQDAPPEGASPPQPPLPVIDLFSAPTRPLLPGIAVVRATLRDSTADTPAANAVVTVTVKGKSWSGIANDEGEVAIFFPYPPADLRFSCSSPPVTVLKPLTEQKWEMSATVAYSPATLSILPPRQLERGAAKAAAPELTSILRQRPAAIWQEPPTPNAAPPAFQLRHELSYGRELVLRSGELSVLFIDQVLTSP